MPNYLDLLPTKLLSSVLQVCEEMTLPGSKPPTVSVEVGSAVQGALPAPSEILPLVIVFLLFVGTAAWIALRGSEPTGKQASGRVTESSPSEAFI